MAQLKDTVVSGSLRATDSLLTTTLQAKILSVPSTSGGSAYGPGTNGQIILSNGTSAYWSATTAITSLGTVTTGTWSATTINPNKGGTGVNSYAKGDILYAGAAIANTATTALSKLAIGTAGYFLKATANGPAWANTTDITTLGTITTGTWNATTIGVGYGGTGTNTTPTANGIIYASSASAYASTAAGSDGYILIGKGASTAPTWQEILPIAHGGTGTKTAPTANGIIYASSTTTYASTSAGTDGYILIGKGASTAPTWQEILPISHGGTGTKTAPTQGGVIYASSGTAYASTSAGTSGYLLQSGGTSAPSWIQATDANTASTIVKRDASGGFNAGTISAGQITVRAQSTTVGGEIVLNAPDTTAYSTSKFTLNTYENMLRIRGNDVTITTITVDTGSIVTRAQTTSATVAIRIVTPETTYVQLGVAEGGRMGVYTNGYLSVVDSVRTHNADNSWLIYRETDGTVRTPAKIAWAQIYATTANPDVYQVKTYSYTYTLNANTSANYTATNFGVSTPSGYTPVAILSFTSGSGDCQVCAIYGQSTGSSGFMTIKNTSSSKVSSKTATVKMLYFKS